MCCISIVINFDFSIIFWSRLRSWHKRRDQESLLLMSFKEGHSGINHFSVLGIVWNIDYVKLSLLTEKTLLYRFFSISNLGMYPVDHFCAIINPPQVIIGITIEVQFLLFVIFGGERFGLVVIEMQMCFSIINSTNVNCLAGWNSRSW